MVHRHHARHYYRETLAHLYTRQDEHLNRALPDAYLPMSKRARRFATRAARSSRRDEEPLFDVRAVSFNFFRLWSDGSALQDTMPARPARGQQNEARSEAIRRAAATLGPDADTADGWFGKACLAQNGVMMRELIERHGATSCASCGETMQAHLARPLAAASQT